MTGSVHDLVLYHGDLVDPTRDYVHKNRSFKTFGRYGDIMIRDRKMYVPKTAQGILTGLDNAFTLVLPADVGPITGLSIVSTVTRTEVTELTAGYAFDFATNELATTARPNFEAGRDHTFNVYRPTGDAGAPVRLQSADAVDLDAIAEPEE